MIYDMVKVYTTFKMETYTWVIGIKMSTKVEGYIYFRREIDMKGI